MFHVKLFLFVCQMRVDIIRVHFILKTNPDIHFIEFSTDENQRRAILHFLKSTPQIRHTTAVKIFFLSP